MLRTFAVFSVAVALAVPARAQRPGDPVTSGPGSVYVSPYGGYIWYGDLFDFGDDIELTNDDGFMWGVQAGYSFSPNFSVIGNFAYNKSDFRIEDGSSTVAATGDIGVYMYDANLQFRLPYFMDDGWVAPLGQVGVGAVRYTTDTDDFQSDGTTDVAFNLGIGADFQLLEGIGLRVLLKDYITSLSWTDEDEVSFDDDVDDNVAHSWALSFGLNFGF